MLGLARWSNVVACVSVVSMTGVWAATFNPMTAVAAPTSAPTGITAALNTAMAGKNVSTALEQSAIAEIPHATGSLVEGFVMAYFARVVLEPGEKSCIEQNIRLMAQDGAGLLTLAGTAIADIVEKKPPQMLSMISGASSVIEMATTVQNLVRGCVRADAVAVMNTTFHHLKNPQYVQGRLLANGIDIARVVADAIPAYEANNFTKVGMDFGTLLRKILLSRNSGSVEMVLPEGMPKSEVGEAIVNGVIAGMFVEGTTMDVKNTEDPTIDIHVDLHKCIAKETKYFTAAINALYLAVAQIITNIEQFQLQKKGIQTGYVVDANQYQTLPGTTSNLGVNGHVLTPGHAGGLLPRVGDTLDWMSRLSGVMSNIPVLMERCGFSPAEETMVAKALKVMETNHFTFQIPGPQNRAQAGNMAAVKFAEAAEEWKVGHYKDFGFLLGGLMRDLLLTIFPERYHIDHAGRLVEYVESKTAPTRLGDSPAGSFTLIIGGMSTLIVLGLSVIRVARRYRTSGAMLLEAEAVPHADCEAPLHGGDIDVE